MAVRIVTDSTADLPSDVVEQLGMIVVYYTGQNQKPHLTDSIDTESLSARGRSVWVHSSRVGFLDSRVPCNSLPARVGQD